MTTADAIDGRGRRGGKNSLACEGRCVPMGFRQREAAAGKALAAAKLTAAADWHSGDSSSGGARPKVAASGAASGERR